MSDVKTCKRCGKPADAKVFGFNALNAWDDTKGMHRGCGQQDDVDKAAQQGFQATKQPEGEPLPKLPRRNTEPTPPPEATSGP